MEKQPRRQEPDLYDPVVDAAFRSLDVYAQTPPDFYTRVLERIARRQTERRRSWGGVPALVAAGLVLSLTLHAWYLYHDLAQPSPVRSPLPEIRGPHVDLPTPPAKQEKSLSTLLQEGDQYARAGETDRAIDVYREAINQLALPLNQLAWLLHTQGRAAEGLPLARLAVQLRPDEVEYLDTLIALLCKEGKPAEAVELLEQAAKHVPPRSHDRLERMRQGLCQ